MNDINRCFTSKTLKRIFPKQQNVKLLISSTHPFNYQLVSVAVRFAIVLQACCHMINLRQLPVIVIVRKSEQFRVGSLGFVAIFN